MAFDYEAHDTPDDIVRGIAAEMSDSVLKPLTDVEIAEREEWRRDYLARQEQERLAAERHRLEQERERQAVAQHEQALVTAKLREKAAADRQQQLTASYNAVTCWICGWLRQGPTLSSTT